MDTERLTVKGQVVRDTVAAGSKSERPAVMLKTDEGRTLLLRQSDGPAFGDNALDALVGSTIQADGIRVGQTLIMKDWKIEE